MSARRRANHPLHWKSLLCFLFLAALESMSFGKAAEPAAVPSDWRTPAEAAGYEATPLYEETLAFLRRVGERLPELKLESYGSSAAGRPMTVAILSKEHAFTPEAAARLAKPVLLVFSGIHAGEIDGKDATLELLRDLALGRRRELLDAATVLFVPVYNVDGHERVSPYNRPNQDGPVKGMGFRTTADGHDLNRDWLKLDTPEARALVGLFARWRPHLVVDVHVTNGSDHDWTFTWSVAESPMLPTPLDAWNRAHLPAALAAVERAGYPRRPVRRPDRRQGPGEGVRDRARHAALLDRVLPAAQPDVDPGRNALAQAVRRARRGDARVSRRPDRRGRSRWTRRSARRSPRRSRQSSPPDGRARPPPSSSCRGRRLPPSASASRSTTGDSSPRP